LRCGEPTTFWLLKWLKKEKNFEPALYVEPPRTPAVHQSRDSLTAGTRYLSPSQKMARGQARRRERNRAAGRV
jgi:hypothetical protein